MPEEKELKWSREKGDERAVVEPRASKVDPSFHDPVILCPVGPLVELCARIYKARKTIRPFEPAKAYTLKNRGRKYSLVGPAMGAPAAVYVLERLVANGVGNVIVLGLCGSISPRVKIGDIVAPDWGLINEGTSRQYVPNAKRSAATQNALAAVRKAMAESGKSYHLGTVWTTDAVFRETRGKIKEFGGRGILAVEMEISALFTVAHYRGVEVGALLVVSDELFDLRWRPGFTRPRFLASCRHACHLALSAAEKLAARPGRQRKGVHEGEAQGRRADRDGDEGEAEDAG